MSSLLSTTVQTCPFAAPVEWHTVRTFVQLIQLLQVVILDCAGPFNVEQSEGDLVLGIWFGQEVFEGTPIGKADLARLSAICDPEENGILLALDLVLDGRITRQSMALESFV